MLVDLIAKDKPDHLEVRTANRPAHVEYLKSSDQVSQAGPLLSQDGHMIGSLINSRRGQYSGRQRLGETRFLSQSRIIPKY